MAAAAEGEHSVAELDAKVAHRRLVLEALLLEGAKGVRCHHLGPLVGVVAGRVAACEDVREAAQELVVGQGGEDSVVCGHLRLHVKGRLVPAGREGRVEVHVELGEVELTEHAQPRVEVACALHLGKEVGWEGLPSLVVPCEGVKRGLVVAPVLHELRGQLNGIPLDVVDARGVRVGHGCEHVLKAMPHLVKESLHVAKAEQGRRVAHRGTAVASEVGHGLAVEDG
mmetsp:Transcript_23772/g.73905  ORF Transcript_23772/g.73905 Transcript_23772/m.73905 type:complete len:226 (-) Transcript_23772:282-959(-)